MNNDPINNDKDPPINNDKDTCQQMVSIAELASNQHNDRRQITFRIAIGYTTLLALALYQTTKADAQALFPPNFSYFVSGLIVILTIVYCWALRVLHVASNNDVRRRDFYLKKAECILHHMSQNRSSPFTPDSKDKYIIINLGVGENRNPITECQLFDEKQPDIFIPSMKKICPKLMGSPMGIIDFHYFSLIALPIFLTSLLMLNLLVKGDDSELNVFTILKNWEFPNIFQLKVR